MCGIFGLILNKESNYNWNFIKDTINYLFLLSETRGKEACGISFYMGNDFFCYKKDLPAHKVIKTREYEIFLNNFKNKILITNNIIKNYIVSIGHTRLATNGTEENIYNNQPIVLENIVGVHNGIVVNTEKLSQDFSLSKMQGNTDSEVIFSLVNTFIKNGLSIKETMIKLFKNVEGSVSIAVLVPKEKSLFLGTNTGSIYYYKNNELFIFCSEKFMLEQVIKKIRLQKNFGEGITKQIFAGRGICVSIVNNKEEEIDLMIKFDYNKPQKIFSSEIYFNTLLEKVSLDKKFDLIYKLKRCKKCVLPETYPFIKFDEEGVCNYCKEYKSVKYKGEIALQNVVAKYRRKDGRPDCLVTFSGGRDSSYTLHYVKKVLKMNPIAFTYDWGMVADIARRNQARVVGKLGVEHVIISADIKKQRKFIKENVLAWLKKPHLGMVVLFMAADKPAEYYATKVAKKYGIDLIILSRGNGLENSDFKWGFLGLKKGEPDGVLHNLSLLGRIKFTLNSLWQYILNPAYFNSSIFETFFDYWTTYIITYNFLYMWHYIPWEEHNIINTLKEEYDWETEKDTIQTWRTDDGTSPFYNYIYYTVAGFTENDCFRSNQIREGILSREKALQLVLAENKPRYEAIKDYLNKIGLDYNEVIKKIENISKFYTKK